jgi:hypothetical protein
MNDFISNSTSTSTSTSTSLSKIYNIKKEYQYLYNKLHSKVILNTKNKGRNKPQLTENVIVVFKYSLKNVWTNYIGSHIRISMYYMNEINKYISEIETYWKRIDNIYNQIEKYEIKKDDEEVVDDKELVKVDILDIYFDIFYENIEQLNLKITGLHNIIETI